MTRARGFCTLHPTVRAVGYAAVAMLERRLLAIFEASSGDINNSTNSSSCEICGPILNDAAQVCIADDLLSDDAAKCLDEDGGGGAFGMYVIFWRCAVHASPFSLIFLGPWLLMLLLALGSTADNFLMPQLSYLSEMLRLSPDVAGVTLLAFGNGAPDVFSAIAVSTGNVNKKLDLSFMLSDIVGG